MNKRSKKGCCRGKRMIS